MLFSQARQMFAHSRGNVFRSRSSTQIAENFAPQSIGTGEHLSNDGIDDWQVSRSSLVNGTKLRPTVAQIDRLARQCTYKDRQSGINYAVKCENTRGALY